MTEVSNTILANQTAYNVSKLLDSLLQDYDNSLRPDFAGNLEDRYIPQPSVRQTAISLSRSVSPDRSEHASSEHGTNIGDGHGECTVMVPHCPHPSLPLVTELHRGLLLPPVLGRQEAIFRGL